MKFPVLGRLTQINDPRRTQFHKFAKELQEFLGVCAGSTLVYIRPMTSHPDTPPP